MPCVAIELDEVRDTGALFELEHVLLFVSVKSVREGMHGSEQLC